MIDGLAGWFVAALLAFVFITEPASRVWLGLIALIMCGALYSALASVQAENDELRRNQRP